jgi:2-polyprenyl-3-methyl-5-hydroxy-6-metoxy-1,4-benzoquinol methylase
MQNASTFEVPTQKIRLDRLPQGEPILDIGGGGEGLVSRIEGARVCAIDIRMDEIREARIHDPRLLTGL